jgi:hypothetical protein
MCINCRQRKTLVAFKAESQAVWDKADGTNTMISMRLNAENVTLPEHH